ncbi:MAG: zinc-ribbon domain-containing protein [Bacteroidota bacterium]
MNPKILCSKCSQEIRQGDKFCSSCGATIEWGSIPPSKPPETPITEKKPQTVNANPVQCPRCGTQNPAGTSNCSSCGAALPGAAKTQPVKKSVRPEAAPYKPTPLKALQSWKVTVGVAVILIAIIIGFRLLRNGNETVNPVQKTLPNDAHQNQALMNELETLEKAVQANPNDAEALLQLANHLQDAKFLDKAVDAYKRYLEMKPGDANAVVDLGVTYYQMATDDTTRRFEDLELAQNKFMDALKINKKHQLAHFNLGVVNLMRGDLMTANEWFKKTVALDSTTETGKRALMLIQQHTMKNNSSQ